MRTRKRRVASILFVVSVAALAAPPDPTVFGDGVTVGEIVSVADLMVRPESYIDREVQVEGVVTAVSPDGGRWIDLADKSGSRTVRFQPKGDAILFPADVKGRHAMVEGVFRKVVLTEAEATARARRQARERGEEFDPATAVVPRAVFVIEGTGAVVR